MKTATAWRYQRTTVATSYSTADAAGLHCGDEKCVGRNKKMETRAHAQCGYAWTRAASAATSTSEDAVVVPAVGLRGEVAHEDKGGGRGLHLGVALKQRLQLSHD